MEKCIVIVSALCLYERKKFTSSDYSDKNDPRRNNPDQMFPVRRFFAEGS